MSDLNLGSTQEKVRGIAWGLLGKSLLALKKNHMRRDSLLSTGIASGACSEWNCSRHLVTCVNQAKDNPA